MRILRLSVGSRNLAIDLRWVREVCPFVHLQPLPSAPAWLRGLCDYHGALLPVADMGALLDGQAIEPRIGARLVLLQGAIDGSPEGRLVAFGMLVDRVDGTDSLDRSGSWNAPEGLPGLPFVREVAGVARTIVLDPAVMVRTHVELLGRGAIPPRAELPA
jgi:chemotaxis-related protein WspB